MKTSTDRILTTHVGSIPRPENVRALLRARLAPSDRKARKARPGHKARRDPAVNVVRRDRKEPLAPLARQGLPVRKVIPVRRRPIAS